MQSLFRRELQHVLGGVRLAKPRKDLFDAETVCLRVHVGDCIGDDNDVIAIISSAARRCFNTGACRNTCQKDLSYATLAQDLIEVCTDERTYALLADDVVTRLLLQFGHKVGPIFGKREFARSGVGPARSGSRHVDQYDRQAALAEGARKLSRTADNFAGGVNGRKTDDALLKVNDDQGGSGIECC